MNKRMSIRELIELKDKKLKMIFQDMESATEIRKWLLWKLEQGEQYLHTQGD